MKNIIIINLCVFLFLIASCSSTPPTLKNPENGIAVIPLEVTNRSGWKFARYYEIVDERRPDLRIKVHPQRSQAFVFSRELPAGEYNFTKIKHIINPEYESQDSVYEQSIIVPVHIEPGSLTILDEKLVVRQIRSSVNFGDGAVSCQCYFQQMTLSERQAFVKKLKETIGESQWKLASGL